MPKTPKNKTEHPVAILLKNYRAENNLQKEDVAAKTGLKICTIDNVEKSRSVSAHTVNILAKKLSPIFKSHIEYTTCTICGAKFAATKINVKTCSPACSEIRRKNIQEEWRNKNENYNSNYQQNERKSKYKRKIKAEEFETLSRAAGLTYGQRQTLERLGQLNTEPEILWGT